jgi:hypothetical protein
MGRFRGAKRPTPFKEALNVSLRELVMPGSEILSHPAWDCKCHVALLLKPHRKVLDYAWRRRGAVLGAVAEHQECVLQRALEDGARAYAHPYVPKVLRGPEGQLHPGQDAISMARSSWNVTRIPRDILAGRGSAVSRSWAERRLEDIRPQEAWPCLVGAYQR